MSDGAEEGNLRVLVRPEAVLRGSARCLEIVDGRNRALRRPGPAVVREREGRRDLGGGLDGDRDRRRNDDYEQRLPVRSPRTQPASISHSGSFRVAQRRTPLCA